MPIPQLIHQTWKTQTVPAHWASSEAKYRALEAEGWTYKLWTDEDNRALIRDHFPWFLAHFDAYPYPIQRADAVRYFILYKFGGIYSDLDIQPKANFTAFYQMYRHADLALPSTKSGNGFGTQNLSNCFMMSAPVCPFWPLVWEHLQDPFRFAAGWKRVLANSHHFRVLFTTGPGIINDAAAHYKGEIVRIPAALIQPGVETDPAPVSRPESVVELLRGQSWHRADTRFWHACGSVLNHALEWTLILCAILVVVVIVIAVLWHRCRHTALRTDHAHRSTSSRSM